ncbi:GPS2 family protein [Megaselia abdita]
MPVATNTQAEDERLRAALKTFILNDRQKTKKAEDEMDRLRKEYDEKERETEAELTENRLELSKVDKRIEELRNQKEQLCFQLKKKIANNQQPEKKFEPMGLRIIHQQYDQEQQQKQQKHNQAIHTPMYVSQVQRTSSQQPPPNLAHHQQLPPTPAQQQPPQPQQHLQAPLQQTQIIQPNQQHIVKGMNNTTTHVQQQPSSSAIVGNSNRRTIHFPDDLNDKSAYLHVNPPIKRGRSTSPPHQQQPPPPQPQHQNLQSMYKGSPYVQSPQPQSQKHQWSKPSQPSQPHHPSQQQQKPQQYAMPPGAFIFPSNSLSQHPGHHPGPPPSQSDARSSRDSSSDSGRGGPPPSIYLQYSKNFVMEIPPHPHYPQAPQPHIYLNSNDKRTTHIQVQQSQQSQHSSSPSSERGHGSSQHHHQQHQQQQQQHHSQHHHQQQQQQQQPKSMPSPKTVWPYDKNPKLPGFHRMEYATDSIDMTRTPPLPQQPPSPQSSRWRKQGQPPPPNQGHMPLNSYKFVHHTDKYLPMVEDRYIEMMVPDGRSSPPTRYICHDGVLTSLHPIPKGFSFSANNSQISKTGSITQGYPTSRSSSMHPQQPPQMGGQPPQQQQQQYKHLF